MTKFTINVNPCMSRIRDAKIKPRPIKVNEIRHMNQSPVQSGFLKYNPYARPYLFLILGNIKFKSVTPLLLLSSVCFSNRTTWLRPIRSLAIMTFPFEPTIRASGKLKKPIAQPKSRTVIPFVTYGSNIFLGF